MIGRKNDEMITKHKLIQISFEEKLNNVLS